MSKTIRKNVSTRKQRRKPVDKPVDNLLTSVHLQETRETPIIPVLDPLKCPVCYSSLKVYPIQHTPPDISPLKFGPHLKCQMCGVNIRWKYDGQKLRGFRMFDPCGNLHAN